MQESNSIASLEVERFSVSYDADDDELSIHKMDAFYLGQAIQQVATMVKQAGKILNEEEPDVKVTTPAAEGSFIVEFAVYAVAHPRELLTTLGFFGSGALAVAHHIRDKKVININTSDDNDEAVITVESRGRTEEVRCNKNEALLATDSVIRKSYNEIITQPLSQKNSPVFKVIVDGRDTLRLDGSENIEFPPLPRKSMTFENVEHVDATVSLTQVNFTSVSGWKMIYHGEEFSVKMEDAIFMERVLSNQQSFEKGDLFSVRLRIKTIEKPDSRPSVTYAIEYVYRHLADESRRIQ
ncbi:hypothetical protein [Proteus mirabilis]|uniref:Uncharacterized protein n=2 Tax=Proteus mirabilis TaxID=584 RepID=A0A7D5W8Z2_PROMI|nr:hypothetical protein [Proteus mirabilis]MBA7799752.1 hypothetical protein [Citrobacter sp. RHBSTW-01065]ATC78641.1 hypothetical protein BG029_09390 [Proteus mirabilis]EJD6334695.1 hypothetical protein [Proteus mirabilis]EJD6351185.1 hypothetical protein [Proteus mirabilis]EJD6359874.1 hypothetical protein [Proteus mirabilis]